MKMHILALMVGATMMAPSFASANAQEKRVVPLVDGMTITAGDVVSNIEFRAKSFGPGVCAVEVSASTHEKRGILAPPLTWSNWIPLTAHIGPASFTLNYKASCDTGAIVEVRYTP